MILKEKDGDVTTVAVCQINVVARHPYINATKIIDFLHKAKSAGAHVAVFPENAIPGYMVGDDWEDNAFLQDCAHYTEHVFQTADELGIGVVLGSVAKVTSGAPAEDGRAAKQNNAYARVSGQTLRYSKINLPNYREFDDKRYFVPGTDNNDAIEVASALLSLSICEDGWDDDYTTKPIDMAREIAARATTTRSHIHVNLSCSPFTTGKNDARNRRFARHSLGFAALVYCNNVGVQNTGKNVFVFDGSSTLYVGGKEVASLPPFVECMATFHVIGNKVEIDRGTMWNLKHEEPKISSVLTYGIREFCDNMNIKRVVIGLSGGIDSALSLMLHVEALGAENVVAVNMPTRFNSATTKGIAADIAENLGVKYIEIPISDAVAAVEDAVRMATAGLAIVRDDSENVQARMRGAGIQALLAAQLGAVFPNNGNKAETTVGYCTLMGDHAGYLAPIADLWKGEVYAVARELSERLGKCLPDEIFDLKPSAELSADHDVDAGKGDPIVYWYHDALFASWMQPWNRDNIQDTLSKYRDNRLLSSLGLSDRRADFNKLFPTAEAFIADLERWWLLFKGLGAVKRVQSPPILTVSRRAYGFDFRETIGTAPFTNRYLELKNKTLNREGY